MRRQEIIAQNIARIRADIASACARAGRVMDDVTIIGVTKSVDRETADALIAAGIRDIAENRVQDAVAKFGSRSNAPPLPDDVRLHMIGNAQTNKARDIVTLFSVLHSLNREGLATALQRAAAHREDVLPVLLEVNTGRDPNKEGVLPEHVESLMGYVSSTCPSLRIVGLMTIAPLTDDPESARSCFSALRQLRDDLSGQFPHIGFGMLSMGMSDDFAVAVEEGATHVRIGRALFRGLPSQD